MTKKTHLYYAIILVCIVLVRTGAQSLCSWQVRVSKTYVLISKQAKRSLKFLDGEDEDLITQYNSRIPSDACEISFSMRGMIVMFF
jgi:hypothetical protein